jgi:hypothetical protein
VHADSSSCRRPKTLYGADFVKGVPCGAYRYFSTSVSLFDLDNPFPRPDPYEMRWSARAEAVKDGARSATRKGFVLDGFEHDGTLVVVGMTKVRGEPRVWCTNIRATSLYSVGEDPDHDAVMRIAAKAPRRRTHSAQRHQSRGFRRDPATSNRHRQPVTSVADRAESVRCSLTASSPFSVPDGGRDPRARRRRARGATRR